MRYTPEEDALITAHYSNPEYLLGKLPHRTWRAIQGRAQVLGVRFIRSEVWTLEEISIVRASRRNLRRAQRLLPHRTYDAIAGRSAIINAKRLKRWSPVEDEIVRRLAATHTDAEIASALGTNRTTKAVERRRHVLQISRRLPPVIAPLAVVEDIRREARLRGVSLKKLGRALGHGRLPANHDSARLSHPMLMDVVKAFRGELYAEWID